jgi:hypothetical protein
MSLRTANELCELRDVRQNKTLKPCVES